MGGLKSGRSYHHLKLPYPPTILKTSLARVQNKGDGSLNLLIAVSGGADSMCLLASALELIQTDEINLLAAHLIHHPQSAEAKERALMVENFCRVNLIPYIIEELIELANPKLSPEDRMRQLRYQFLERVASAHSSDFILTGHHADDQAETILERVISGTGLKGLAGIPMRRGKILRPFLRLKHDDLIRFCKARNIPYQNDPTNEDLSSPRNRLRCQLLPQLEESMNPAVKDALCRLGDWASEANHVIESETDKAFEKSLVNFQKSKIVLDILVILTYFTMLQKGILLKAISVLRGTEPKLDAKAIDQLMHLLATGRTGAYLELADNLLVLRHGDMLVFSIHDIIDDFKITIQPGENRILPELSLEIVWEVNNIKKPNSGKGNTASLYLGPDPGEIVLRHARVGDHFHPLGAAGQKRLFRFLTDCKVSRFDKFRTLVITRAEEIIWVVEHRISEKVKVQPQLPGNWTLTLKSTE